METESSTTYLRRNTPEYRRVTVALVAAAFTTFALLYCVQPLMPVFASYYAVSPTVSSLSLSVATAMIAVGMLIMGPISDAVGRKNVMTCSLFTVSVLSVASGFAPNWTSLLVIRALEGIALAGVPAVGMAYLAEEVHPQDLAGAMGLYIAGNAFGGLTGRILTGFLVDLTDSARVALTVIGLLGVLAAVVFVLALPPSRHFVPERGISLSRLQQDLVRHLTDPVLLLLYAEGFLLMGSFASIYNYASFRLLAPPFSLGQGLAGMVFLVYLVGGQASALFGRFSNRMGKGFMLLAGMVLMLAGLMTTLSHSLVVFILGLALMTSGFFGAHAIASGWVSRRAIMARGQAASLYLFCYYVGSSVIGSSGGQFWSLAGWPGIAILVTSLLAIAMLVGFVLKRVERSERLLSDAATER